MAVSGPKCVGLEDCGFSPSDLDRVEYNNLAQSVCKDEPFTLQLRFSL